MNLFLVKVKASLMNRMSKGVCIDLNFRTLKTKLNCQTLRFLLFFIENYVQLNFFITEMSQRAANFSS